MLNGRAPNATLQIKRKQSCILSSGEPILIYSACCSSTFTLEQGCDLTAVTKNFRESNVCASEPSELVRNDPVGSNFPWNQQELVHLLLRENTGQTIFQLSRSP